MRKTSRLPLRSLAVVLAVTAALGALLGAAPPLSAQEVRRGYSIEDATDLARENASELTIERLRLMKAAAAVREAKARRGPKVTLQTSGSVLSNPQEGFKIEKGAFGYAPTLQSAAPVAVPDRDYVLLEDAEHTYFRITATLAQPIFTSGKIQGAVKAAEFGLLVAEREYESKVREIERQVRNAYFGAMLAGTTVRILTTAQETAADIVADRQFAFDEGIITRVKLLEVISREVSLASQAAAAREAERSARQALTILTGDDFSQSVLYTEYRSDLPDLDEKSLVAAGTSNSPVRAALLHRIEQATALVEIEKGSRPFLPDISLNVSVEIAGQRVPILGANWTESWDTNLIVTIGSSAKLFDSGVSASRIEQARHTLEIAGEGLAALDQGFELQVRRSVEAIRSAWFEIKRAAADLDLVREVEKNARVSFENELITNTEYLAARLAALAAELGLERARYLFETGLIELEAAVGGTVRK